MLNSQFRGFELQLPNVLLDRDERAELVGLAQLDTALFQQRSQERNLIRHLLRTLLLAGVATGPSLVMDGSVFGNRKRRITATTTTTT